MSIAKVTLAFTRLPDAPFSVFVDSVIQKMTGNARYLNPDPPLASVQTLLTSFQDSLAKAKGGGVALTAAKNAAREPLLGAMRSLALYVQEECDGDLAVLLSSGFQAAKTPAPVGVLPAPTGVTLSQGTLSGSLNLRGEALNNAGSYEGQKTTQLGNPSTWETVGNYTAPRMTFGDLSPGTTYWARMRAIGSAGPGAWSEPVKAMAL